MKPIPNFPKYFADKDGEIWSFKYLKPKKLKQRISKKEHNPYKTVRIYNSDSKLKCKNIHTLVTRAFLGVPQPGQVVRHLNSNKHDNRIRNLTYGTAKENAADSIKMKTHWTAKIRTHCPHGHEYTKDNLIIDMRKDGYTNRRCRECKRLRTKIGRKVTG